MSLEFPPHGEFRLYLHGKILVAQIIGGWNKEAAEQYEREFKRVAASLTHDKWAHIVYMDEWDLGVPEIGSIIKRLVNWCIDNGLVRAAHIYQSSLTKQFLVDKMVEEQVGEFIRKIFTDEPSAFAWLTEQGFAVDLDSMRALKKAKSDE